MNDYSLKITGTGALPEALDATKSLKIQTDLDIYEVSKRDNQDGTYHVVYKAKITSSVDVQQGEKVIMGKDKSKASQRLRWAIQAKADALGIDREEHYQKEMQKLIQSYNE